MSAVREVEGELWDYLGRAVVAITTNGAVDRRGAAIMPRGCARQARERFPELPATLGALLQAQGNHVFELGGGLVSFPVEHHWLDRPDLGLIDRSAAELVALADRRGWREVVVPRPGCGGGGLEWREVKPILEKHFDGRFVVMTDGR